METSAELGMQLVGREQELEVLDGFLATSGLPRALVLTGGAGIGKTALWEAAVAMARRRGMRVLTTTGSGAEKQLSFAALIDLFDDVGSGELAGLPSPQLHALEVALLRAEPDRDPFAPPAINVGFLNALRGLAEHDPLLVGVDDVQWLDAASVEALIFSSRRLDDRPVRFLLAQRSRRSSIFERAFGPGGLTRLDVAPLDLAAIRRMLAARLGLNLSRHALYRIVEASLGNPLFALELGRALADRPPLAVDEDVPFPDTVEELLGTRVAALPAPVRTLLLAVALSNDVRIASVVDIVEPAAIDDGVDAGVLVVDGDRVRPAHPLFAAAAKTRARTRERRELHHVLAQIAIDGESRALHLALASPRPDAHLAATLATAAAAEAARGARRDAVLLAEHALRMTPQTSGERHERLLTLGSYLVSAGERQRITDLLLPELDSLPRGPARASALQLLTAGAVDDNDEIRQYLADALAESEGDAAMHASVLVELAENDAVIRVQGIRAAETTASEALAAVSGSGADLERRALYCLSWARALGGKRVDDLCERFRETGEGASYSGASPERVAGQRLFWRGEVGQARAAFRRLLALADERGESYSYVLQRLHLCQLELRAGNWDEAARYLGEWAESSEFVMWPMYERCHALLAAGRGFPEEAERWAAETLAKAEATGTQWDRLEALRARGTAALLAHEPAGAAADLRIVWEHTEREGVDDPGVFPVAPELVDALVELGANEEAGAVIARLQALAVAQEHPWALTTAERCRALVELSSQDGDEAASTLTRSASDYARLGLRFDYARTLLSLGRLQRRSRRWGSAREALERAATEFADLGSHGWAEDANAELSRVGARKPRQTTDELTPTEQRVAQLAADGLTNKEIAQSLFISVRTVEVHLKRAYAKLGIRSRTQLARYVSEPTVTPQ